MKNTNYVEKINIDEFVNNLNREEFSDFLELWWQGQPWPTIGACNTEVWNAANCISDNYCFDENSDDEEFEEAKHYMIIAYDYLIQKGEWDEGWMEMYDDEWYEMNKETFNEIFEEWFEMHDEEAEAA